MTHNIIAEFSCSIDSYGNFKQYPVVTGSVFNEEYNETLDSATLVLSQVKATDRLSYIKPYDFVRVYDKSTYDENTGKYSFDKTYLVDNFHETENNIEEHIFGYTINLMSETKLLEKFQCPNLTITHKINEDGTTTKKPIYQYIKQYMELYVPKVKMAYKDGNTTKWRYEPLISYPADFPASSSVQSVFQQPDFIEGENENYTLLLRWPIPDYVDASSVSIINYSFLNSDVQFSSINVYFNATTRQIVFQGVTQYEYIGSGTVIITYRFNDNDFTKRFNTPCADLAFSAPTFRQLLTTLMQQNGCIPTIKNRVLGYLDFQIDAQNFNNGDYTVDKTVNKITRSLASDSYVNSLINISDQVLDSGNEVISETLCFRNSENTLLRQQENLHLETSFPIYKITKAIMHAPGHFNGYINSSFGCVPIETNTYGDATIDHQYQSLVPSGFPAIFYQNSWLKQMRNETRTVFSFDINISDAQDAHGWMPQVNQGYLIKDINVTFLNNVNNKMVTVGKININSFEVKYDNTEMDVIEFNGQGYNNTFQQELQIRKYRFECEINALASMAWISGVFVNKYENKEQRFIFFKFDYEYWNSFGTPSRYVPNGLRYYGWEYIRTINDAKSCFALLNLQDFGIVSGNTWDLTKLIVEQQQRELLSRDFNKMGEEININDKPSITIEKLSKYVYGTVGYSIGSKVISGFSEVYQDGNATAFGWIQKDYTYIENIASVLPINQEILEGIYETFGNFPLFMTNTENYTSFAVVNSNTFINGAFEYYNPNTGDTGEFSSHPFFTTFFFDITYQPLNSFNMAYVKQQESVDYPLEQYDSGVGGLTDFDRLSLNEQEQVDRIGNETLNISQRTIDYNKIQTFENGPLYFMDDTNRSGSVDGQDNGVKYIIFKRSFSIGNNCYNASYVGSKDAILKDYFTSIRTKYRAYQYTDFGQSTTRKERDTFYIRVASDNYNADDKVWLGPYAYHKPSNLKYFIYSADNSVNKHISYECEKDVGKIWNNSGTYVNELQTVKNSVSVITTHNILSFVYEYMDYIGAGTYINDIAAVAGFKKGTTTSGDTSKLGGIPQQWQIWGDSYNEKHTVSFVNKISFYNDDFNTVGSGSTTRTRSSIQKIQKSPVVDASFINLENSDNLIFSICDDNSSIEYNNYKDVQKTFYKDAFELINHTVQFIYYAPDNDVLFGEDFIGGTPLVGRYDNPFNLVLKSDNFEINTNEYDIPNNNDVLIDNSFSQTIVLDVSNEISNDLIIDSSGNSVYEHVFEFDYTTLPDYLNLLFDVMNPRVVINNVMAGGAQVTYSSCVVTQLKNEGKLVCKIRSNWSPYGLFTIYVTGFINTFVINTVDIDNIPVLRVYWGDNNIIKICSKTLNGTIKDIAVFKRTAANTSYDVSTNENTNIPMQRVNRAHLSSLHLINSSILNNDNNNDSVDLIPYTDFYFTINDTKTDYVLSDKNGILYRRYKVNTGTGLISRTVKKIYPNEED